VPTVFLLDPALFDDDATGPGRKLSLESDIENCTQNGLLPFSKSLAVRLPAGAAART